MVTEAVIFNIQRYSIHDGPGIRTLVFFKGCPLRCIWCSNPEGIATARQVKHKVAKCVDCGACVAACPLEVMEARGPQRYYADHAKCTACGRCISVCRARAKGMWGEVWNVDELIRISTRDQVFYESSGGGVTLGGGEPLLQLQAASEMLAKLRNKNIDTAIETCGYYGFATLKKVAPLCNTIHLDLKGWEKERHKAQTGGDIQVVLDNITRLDALIGEMDEKPAFIVRIPLYPGLNIHIEDMNPLGSYLSELRNLSRLEIMPFHNFGVTKYEELGLEYSLKTAKNIHAEHLADYLGLLEKYAFPVKVNSW